MKKIFTIAFVLAFVLGFFPGNIADAGQQVDYPLMAGQTTQVGMIHVFDDGTDLTVQYEITEPGWFIVATHLYVGPSAPKNGAPGQFPYSHTALHATTDTYIVPIVVGQTYYIAAHAVVANEENIVGWDCPTTLDDIDAAFPDSGTVFLTRLYPIQSYYDLVVTTNSGILNGTYSGWCSDNGHLISTHTTYSANFYSSYETLPDYLITGLNPNIDKPENLDLVNWVINQDFPFIDTQRAIWYLIDVNQPYCDAACMEIVNQALGHDGFVPNFAAGDVVAIVVAPQIGETVYQALVLEFGPECTPIYQEETSWASAGGNATAFKTGWGSYFTYTP